jgi:hypothetical protein
LIGKEDTMQDNLESHREREVRREARNTGILVAVLAVFAVVAVAMWYGGLFGDVNTTGNQTAPAPPGSSGTVGQAPQNPGQAPANR